MTWGAERTWAFVADAVDATWDMAWETVKLAYRLTPFHAVYNPEDFSKAWGGLASGLIYTVTHPWEFFGWSEITDGKPGRAVPAILSTLFGVKGLKGAKGAMGAPAAGGAADDAARVSAETKAAAEARAAAEAARYRVGPHGEMITPRLGMESHHGVMSK